MKIIDNFLNKITMYRLVLYYLIFLLLTAAGLSLTGRLPYSFGAIFWTTTILVLMSWAANTVFAQIFKAPTNVESVYISALILALIITPIKSAADLTFLGWAAILAMASKYILAINKKHIFNPAALSVAVTAAIINQAASWWVGTAVMLPFVIAGGILIVRKLKRTDLVLSFLVTSLTVIIYFTVTSGQNVLGALRTTIVDTPLFFFAVVMLTEPLTTPPTKWLRRIYGGLVGLLFAPQIHFGSLYFSPELALISGNIFSYIVSPKAKLFLKLKEKIEVAPNTYDLIFTTDQKIAYNPGQYMEWTLAHDKADSRGDRRYFTLASSPTEETIRLGIKFYGDGSSFKKNLKELSAKTQIVASQLAGDFTLPRDKKQKLVFIAGGIGITPFRSMIKYLVDKREARSIVLFYANSTADQIVYTDVLETARKELGINTVYTLTDREKIPPNWRGEKGFIDEIMVKQFVPDFRERHFYLSGPKGMIDAYVTRLKNMGVPASQIITDFFPGFA